MQEVWSNAPVSGGALLVLLAIADSADEMSRTCFPGIENLAHKARLSERQVKRVISELTELTVIHVDRNASPFKTNLYRISDPANWARSDNMSPPPMGRPCHPKGDAHVTSDGTPMSPKPSVTGEEPSDTRENDLFSGEDTTLATSAKPKGKNYEEAFERFYQAYPLRKEKKGALAKFQQAVRSGIDPEKIIAAARLYADWLDNGGPRDFRPAPKMPTTWLNKGCWDDELEAAAPRGGPSGVHRRSEPWGEVVR